MPQLSDLLTPRTEQTIMQSLLERVVAFAAENGVILPDDWQSGAEYRSVLQAAARTNADVEALLPILISSGFTELASAGWLDIAARDAGVPRNPSAFAVHRVRLTAEAGFGPYTITPGQLRASTPGGFFFQSQTDGNLPLAGTLDLNVIAEHPGAVYNVAQGQITVLNTPLPGVTISNLANSLLEAGREEESDESLRQRIRLRWPTTSKTERVREALERIALDAHPDILKVRVRDDLPRGQNTVDVVIWGAGGISLAGLAAARADLDRLKGITANSGTAVEDWVYPASTLDVPLTANFRVKTGYGSVVNLRARANLQALENRYPIGGDQGKLWRSQVFDALFVTDPTVPGMVQNLELVSPAADLNLTNLQVVRFTPITINIVEV
jgi:phage-related baseplate assembly protein